MPIANCLISRKSMEITGDMVELWSKESGISSEHMTVNVIEGVRQFGCKYTIVSNLYLPTIWSADSVRLLQLGLAHALSKGFDIDLSEIQIVTFKVDSGMAVENGEVQTW